MIAQLGEIRIKISFSFAATVTLMLCFCSHQVVLTALVCSFVHEAGHLIFMLMLSCCPEELELAGFGMRIKTCGNRGLSYNKEALICLAGIIFNLTFALLCLLIYSICRGEIFLMLFTVSLAVALINAVPAQLLDGGRALKYMLLKSKNEVRAQEISRRVSLIFCFLFDCLWLFYTLLTAFNISFTVVTVYLNFISLGSSDALTGGRGREV